MQLSKSYFFPNNRASIPIITNNKSIFKFNISKAHVNYNAKLIKTHSTSNKTQSKIDIKSSQQDSNVNSTSLYS